MKSDSAIFSFIENFPTSASLKTADTGKYIANNIHNSIQFGIKNPKDLEGLTIQDVKFNQKDWGIRYAQLIQDLDRSARKPTFPLLQSLAVVAFSEIVIYNFFMDTKLFLRLTWDSKFLRETFKYFIPDNILDIDDLCRLC
ncbi:putative sugar transporter [Burkholderia pseudomallei MSHR1000]|nr:putative sugar transporter [Burkholderia pseudomallei MSHR1000]